MIDKKLISDLEELLNSVDPTLFPYQKGNSVRIGKYVIRSSKGFYKVFDCETNTMIAETFCKTSAVALAKSLSKGRATKKTILDLDKSIQKWYNDCVFYKYTMKKTKDDEKYFSTYTRYEIARDKTNYAKQQLDKYIY